MAENDDEDGFGDFKFASSNVPMAVVVNDEEDWEEFTNSRFRTAESLTAENSNLFANGFPATESLSAPGLKPKGVIPLSIFGEESEEAESGVGDGSFKTGMISGPKKVNGVKESPSDLNDLIDNLYTQNEKSKGLNGSFMGSALNNRLALVDNQAKAILNGQIQTLAELDVSLNESTDVSFRSKGSDSLWAGFGSISNELVASNKHTSTEHLDRKEESNVSSLAPNGFGSNQNGLVPQGSVYTSAHGSVENDDYGWEFKDAGLTANHKGEQFQGDESKNQKDLIFSFSFPNSSWTEPATHVTELGSNLNRVIPKENGLNTTSGDKDKELNDDDDDEWEFKAVESANKQGCNGTKVEEIGWENSMGSGNSSGFIVNISPDLVSTSALISGQLGELDFRFGLLSSSPSESRAVDTETKSVSSLDDKNIKPEPEKTSSPLASIYSENESKDEGNQTNEGDYVKHKGALPLSIFSDENLETDVPLDSPDISTHKPTYVKPGLKNPASNIPISDIISSLYYESELSSVNHAHNPIEDGHIGNGFAPADAVVSNLVDDTDDVDDGSWEFKDAISEPNSQSQIPVLNSVDSQLQVFTKSKINDLKDFYSKLKAELCLITLFHLNHMKETQGHSAFNEDAELNTLEKEIQDLYEAQYRLFKVSQENPCKGQPSNNFSVDIFSTALKEEKFQLLEAEYQLSYQLSLVEKDVKSATELLKHVISTLEILELGSAEEQSIYVCTWGNILSACARELKHGGLIWKLSLQKNISNQMLAEPLGKQYMIALGEILRVIKVLGCSVELYKPWVLCSSSNSSRILDLLEECSALWSSSGIEEALKTLCDYADVEYDGTIKDLLQSIKNVHDLDPRELYDQVFSAKQPTCHLSGLPLDKIPGMKVVAWEGQDYFLKLANLWANLISHDPPNLPEILRNR